MRTYRDLGTPYDYNSIMHYTNVAFAINRNKPTMRSLKPPGLVNPGETISQIDVQEIRKMYNCKDAPIEEDKIIKS